MVCDTSGDEGLPQYAVITLNAVGIDTILRRHAAVLGFCAENPNVQEVVFLGGSVKFYDKEPQYAARFEINLPDYGLELRRQDLFDMEFVVLNEDAQILESPAHISSDYHVISATSIVWRGAVKSTGDEVESRLLYVEDLRVIRQLLDQTTKVQL